MNQIIEINNQDVTFESNSDTVFTDSLTLAKVFGKRHDNVVRDIENLPKDEFSLLNFEESDYKNERGKTYKMYKMTKDGLSLIALGLTGEKAYQWKVQYINAFNELEKYYKAHTKAEPKKLNPSSKNTLHIEQLATGICVIDDILYIRDLDLGAFMEYKRPHSLRKLVRSLIKRGIISEPLVNIENYAETFYLNEAQVRSCIYHAMSPRNKLLKRFVAVMNLSSEMMEDEEENALTDKEAVIDAVTLDDGSNITKDIDEMWRA